MTEPAATWQPSERELERRRVRRRMRVRSVVIASTAVVVVFAGLGLLVVSSPGWPSVRATFFDGHHARASLPAIRDAFWINVKMFLVAEPLILVLGLAIAVARGARSPWLVPLRLTAVVYTDVIRGVPTILLVLLLEAARTLEPLDVRLSRDTYLDAWGAALFAGHLASPGGGLADVSRAAAAAPDPAARTLPRDLLLDGLALIFTVGTGAAAPTLRRAIAAFAGDDASVDEVLRWGWLAARAAIWLGDHDRGLEIPMRAVQFARDAGALEVLAVADNVCGQAAAWGGDFELADLLAAEVVAVKEATGSRIGPYAAISLVGLRGREAEAVELIDRVIEGAVAGGQGTAVQYAHWARAVLMNGLGRYEEALASAELASGCTPEIFIATWALSELVEAAARTGNGERAEGALARLGEQARETGADWGLGIHAHSRALLSEGEVAERAYREAIDRLGRTRLRPHLARAHLLYGEWLRREHRRVDARAQLRTAHEMLQTIGMEAFADRARGELLATGEKVRKRTDETRDELTPQERQIARLARDGRSNPEIGAQLFLSPRTVEWHLRKVFAKLEIHSRHELSMVLPRSESELAPA